MSEFSQSFDPTMGTDMIQERSSQKRGFDDSDEHEQRGGIKDPDIEMGKDLAKELRTADRDPNEILNEAIGKHMIADNRDGTYMPLTQGGETLLDTHQRLLNEAADYRNEGEKKDSQPIIPDKSAGIIPIDQQEQTDRVDTDPQPDAAAESTDTGETDRSPSVLTDRMQEDIQSVRGGTFSAEKFLEKYIKKRHIHMDAEGKLTPVTEAGKILLVVGDTYRDPDQDLRPRSVADQDQADRGVDADHVGRDATDVQPDVDLGPDIGVPDGVGAGLDQPAPAPVAVEQGVGDPADPGADRQGEQADPANPDRQPQPQERQTPPEVQNEIDLMKNAARVVIESQNASVIVIQNELGISFKDAETLLKKLEVEGIVGQADKNGPRKVLIDDVEKVPWLREAGPEPIQEERVSQEEVAHEQMEGEEQAIINEAIANDKILESRFGQELNAKIDALKVTMDTCRPRGRWEKVVYFFGGGGEKAEKYKEAKKAHDKLESRYSDWQRTEVDYMRQGEKVQQLLEDMAEFQEEKGGQEDSLADLELQLSQLEQDRDEALTPEEREEFERQVAEKASQIAEVKENIRDLDKKIESARKDALKITLGLHKDRSYLETKLLPDIQAIAGIEVDIPIEEGASRLFTKKEVMEDYGEKEKLIEILDEIIKNPSSEEAQYLIGWLKGRMLGAEDEQGEDARIPRHHVARLVFRALNLPQGRLDEKHLDEFLKKESGGSIRVAAQKIRERLAIEGKLQSRSEAVRGDIKQFKSREIFDLLDMQIMAEKGEKASKIGIKKAYAAARFVQNWWHLPISTSKRVFAASVGRDMRGERFLDVDYETKVRDIIEEGSNEFALVLQSSRVATRIASPRNLGTLTSPIFILESIPNWPFQKIFKRSESIRLWTQNLRDRQNNSARRVSERVDAVTGAINDLNVIRRRRRERNREGDRPTPGRRIQEGAGAAGRRAAAEASNAGRQAREKARELGERGFDYVDDILAERTRRRREKRAAKEKKREQRRKNKGGDQNAR